MLEILEFIFRGFWTFLGFLTLTNLILYFTVNGIVRMWGRFMRMLMVRKHGYPTNDLDADGDFNPNK